MKFTFILFTLFLSLNSFAGDQYLICQDANDLHGDSEFLANIYIEDRAEAKFYFNDVSYTVLADISGDNTPRLHVIEKFDDDTMNVKMFDVTSGRLVKISKDVECGVLD
jgi:hypothetical protein